MSQDNIKQIHIQSRADWKENWEKENPILLEREVGYELDTGLYKIGDGEKPWRALSYALGFIYNEENGEYVFNTQGINTDRINVEKIEGNEIVANSLHAPICPKVKDAAVWAVENPILESNEIGYEKDTGLYKIGDGESSWKALNYALGYENNNNKITLNVNSINVDKSIELNDITINSTAPILSYNLNELNFLDVYADISDYENEDLYPEKMSTKLNWCPIYFVYEVPIYSEEGEHIDNINSFNYIHELFADPNWDIELSIDDNFLIQHYYEIAQSEIILTSNGWLYFEGGWQLDAGTIPFNIQVSYRGGN